MTSPMQDAVPDLSDAKLTELDAFLRHADTGCPCTPQEKPCAHRRARIEAADAIAALRAERDDWRNQCKVTSAALARAESAPTSEEAEKVAWHIEMEEATEAEIDAAAALIRQQAREIARLQEMLK